MPYAPALIDPTPSRPRGSRSHLFGAIGTMADAIAREEERQRQRSREEAQRVSGTFFVGRLVDHIRTR